MSCNGCRVLRKGCSDSCVLRPSLDWIQTSDSQGYAVLFVSKFFGRSDLLAFISAVPPNNRPALFQSLLFEACGRTVNPVNGAIGLLSTGNWHVCQAAVETVLAGGTLRPLSVGALPSSNIHEIDPKIYSGAGIRGGCRSFLPEREMDTTSLGSGLSDNSRSFETSVQGEEVEPKLLNLFV